MTTTNESTRDHLSTADFAMAAEARDETHSTLPEGNQSGARQIGTESEHQMPTQSEPLTRRPEDRQQQTPLFTGTDGETFHRRWSDIQASFVDEPRGAVKQADTLVAEVMQRLAQV